MISKVSAMPSHQPPLSFCHLIRMLCSPHNFRFLSLLLKQTSKRLFEGFGRERLLNELVDSDPGRLRNNSSTPKGTNAPKIETNSTANNFQGMNTLFISLKKFAIFQVSFRIEDVCGLITNLKNGCWRVEY